MKTFVNRCCFLLPALLFVNNLHAQVVVIDPGHGVQSDCNNCDRPDEEVHTVMAIALKLEDTIQAHCNWTVHLTRTSNACGQCPTLTQRESMSNSWGADRFLSIHANAGGGTGTETFWCNNSASSNADAQAFATEIQTRMVSYGQWTNRRVVEDNGYLGFHLGVLDNNNAIGCLSEAGFFDNSSDLAKLQSVAWQGQFARAYYVALQNDMNVTCSGGGTNPPANDACANAIALTVSASCVNTQGTVADATASGFAKPSCDGFATPSLKDVWYKFQAASTSHNIDLTGNPDFDAIVALYSSCNSGEMACADDGGLGITETISATSLTIGSTYYIRVYDYGSVDPATPTFNICVTGQAQQLPDLDITSGSVQPTTVNAGSSVTISYTIENTTSGSVSVATETGYYLIPVAQGCPTATPADNFNGGSLTVAEISDGSEAEVHTVTIPAATPPGNYYLAVVTDYPDDLAESDEGNNIFCIQLTVTAAPSGNVTIKADTVQGLPGAQIAVPVKVVSGFTDIISMQFTIEYSTSIVSFSGTQQYGLNALDAANFDTPQAGQIRVSWFDPDVNGETLSNGTLLFGLVFNVTGSGGQFTAISFTGSGLPIEVTDVSFNLINATLNPGRVNILSTVSTSGNIHTEINSPVNSATVNNSCASPFVTAANGNYTFSLNPGSSCTIAPYKNNDVNRMNGVSTLDILMIQRHLLASQLLNSPYKIIAADVDVNGSVSTLDIVRIRSFILGRTNYFPNGRLWRFVPDDFVFANPQIPFPHDTSRYYASISQTDGEDFIAIKLGDVNDSWNPGMAKTSNDGDAIASFFIDSLTASPSTQVAVRVRASGFANIIGMQGSIQFDSSVLSFVSITGFGLPGMSAANFGVQAGKITYLWDDGSLTGVSLPDSSSMFSVVFNVIGSIGQSSSVSFVNAPTPPEVIDNTFNVINVTYKNGRVTVDDDTDVETVSSAPDNVNIFPNPHSGTFSVEIKTARQEEVQITVFNAMGGKLLETFPERANGHYIRSFDLTSFPAAVYMVRVRVGESASIRWMEKIDK